MSAGIDVLSAVVTLIQTLDVVISTIKGLYEARERQLSLSNILSAHNQELIHIRQIVKAVEKEKALQISDILDELKQLDKDGKKLQAALQELGRERSQIKQYARQVLNGQKSLAELASIMVSLSRTKDNLHLKIQIAHVSLTRSSGTVIYVNCKMVERLFGQCKGLQHSERLQNEIQHCDRTRDTSETASLSDKCNNTLMSNKEVTGTKQGTSCTVKGNKSDDESLQVNSPIGTSGFTKFDHISIIDNMSLKKSIQVNHPISETMFDKILAVRQASR